MDSMIQLTQLPGNETVALGATEVISVPHISVIDDHLPEDKINSRYKSETVSLLNELYQIYRSSADGRGIPGEISLELLWKTYPVENQPFRAGIRLYIIARAIASDAKTASELVKSQLSLIHSTLTGQKYEWKDTTVSDLARSVSEIRDSGIVAVLKGERIDNLQNQILPYCYAFDQIPSIEKNLSGMVNVLSEYPDSAISVQIIPTAYTPAELAEIDRTTQLLEMLNRGIMEQGVGNISFTLAEKAAKIYKYYAENKYAALFGFNVIVYGERDAASNIANRFYGRFVSGGGSSSINLQIVSLNRRDIDKDAVFSALPWAANEILINRGRQESIWTGGAVSTSLYRLTNIITGEEASELFRLPIGSDSVAAGLKINETGKASKTYSDRIINSGDITIGILRSSPNADTIGISLKDLTKHMLVVGTPGSGKTTFSVSLLDRLWKQHKIPFLVIEPAKNEYRALVQSIPELQVFTPGKNFISPFVFNPFVPPKNVRLETYKSTLKTAFAAGVSMSTPLDKIFEETVNNCYSDFRWLDNYTVDDAGKTFNIHDFIRCFQETFDHIGYTGDAKNIGRAGLVRLNGLVHLFDNYHSVPIEDILSKPTVIELAAIENSDEKALIIALLLLSILSYVNSNYVGEGSLKNVILLEEAHVLLDASTNAGQGDANPSAIAQGLVKRMLAECRSYGVSLVIADQSPRKVTTDVVALTDIKMAFRLVEASDKQILADSSGMNEVQIQRLPKLKPGEAFLFFNKLEEPEEVSTPDYRLENNISISLSDEGIRKLSTYWKGREDLLRPYPECNEVSCCHYQCCYERRILAREIARRIVVKHCNSQTEDFQIVKDIFSKIVTLIRAELNDEEYSQELKACVKVHLWRKLKYDTKLKITDGTISKSLQKS